MDPQLIEQFKTITNTNDSVAQFYLESAGGDFETAITNYFSNADSGSSHGGVSSFTDDDGDVNMVPQATPLSSVPSSGRTLGGSSVPSTNQPTTSSTSAGTSTSKKPVTSGGGGRKFASIRDFSGDDDDEKPNSKDNKYYAGGSRNSGQQIIGANDSDDDDDNHFADKVFKAAQERGAKTRSEYDDELQQNKPKFEGSGRRLGNTEQSSTLIKAEEKRKEKEVTITFWADGFTVDDGPLRLYDDPQNVQFMEAINKGFAPRELAEPGVDIAVNLLNRKTDKWAEQPKQFKAFVGSGRSLGAPSSSSASSSSSSVSKPTVSSSSSSNLKVEVDNNKPTTSLQIRLADGGRLVGKFNLTHTIGHIRSFIRQSKPSADFDIMTQFPNKVLTDDHLTIEEAGLKGATIIQKLK